jgi:hypothetical protein
MSLVWLQKECQVYTDHAIVAVTARVLLGLYTGAWGLLRFCAVGCMSAVGLVGSCFECLLHTTASGGVTDGGFGVYPCLVLGFTAANLGAHRVLLLLMYCCQSLQPWAYSGSAASHKELLTHQLLLPLLLPVVCVDRSSNGGGDWTPPGSSWTPPGSSCCLNSPLGSTLELDALQLPPNALLSATGTPAASEGLASGPAAQQQQGQQGPRGWSAVCLTTDGSQVSRSSSLGPGPSVPLGLTPRSSSAAGGRSSSIHQHTSSRLSQTSLQQLGEPQGDANNVVLLSGTGSPVLAVSPQPLGGTLSPGPGSSITGGAAGRASSAVTSPVPVGLEGYSSSNGVAWQPVLPRKASLAAAAAASGAAGSGSDVAPAAPGGLNVVPASAALSSGHKRTGSGLFRWLSKAAEGSSSNGSLQ